MDTSAARDLVLEFWRRMGAGDGFASVAELLAPGFELEWPQSGERIRGAVNFVRMNAEYKAHGPWRFTLHRIVAAGGEVVTDVGVTDSVMQGRALSFFSLADVEDAAGGAAHPRIVRVVEFWPEPFEAPANRSHLVEPPA